MRGGKVNMILFVCFDFFRSWGRHLDVEDQGLFWKYPRKFVYLHMYII